MTSFSMDAELAAAFAAYQAANNGSGQPVATPLQQAGTFASSGFASNIGRDRLVRKEESLGAIREIPPPTDQIGLSMFPYLPVGTDDVIFDYIRDFQVDGLVPARAEDAEAELSQKDNLGTVQGRASVIDWAEKDKYTASDVTRYRENLLLSQLTGGAGVNLNLNDPGNAVAEFQARVARDDARRVRKIQNRIEWMIQTSIWTGALAYNDGKIKFSVDWGRPGGQQSISIPTKWDAGTTHDPIGVLMAQDQLHHDTYGVHLRTAITSRKVLNTIWQSDRFIAQAGVVGGTPSSPIDPKYLVPNWSPQAAIDKVSAVTGINFIVYDAVYRTRPINSSTITNNRFSPEKEILLLPDSGDMGQINDTDLGFGRVLTSPHPEGNFTSGLYEWEDETRDPWMTWRGTGIKAFPVFPLLKYSRTLQVLA